MTTIEMILSEPVVQKMGWALLHFIWQGTAVAVALAGVLLLLRRSSARVRYVVACGGLLVMAALPIATMLVMPEAGATVSDGAASAVSVSSVGDQQQSGANASDETMVVHSGAEVGTIEKGRFDLWRERLDAALAPALPWLVSVWLVGVLGLSVRLLAGWAQVQRMKRRHTAPAAERLQAMLELLGRRLRLSRPVRLLESALAQVPMAIGWLRPVILLPASAISGLSPEQLETILAHELAHIRRYDYLVNLVQTVIETLLFYHPAVWWLSRRIRNERENCCDDLAVAACGDRVTYARALSVIAELGGPSRQLAVAAGGGSLLRRVRRLVGPSGPEEHRPSRWLGGCLCIAILVTLGVGAHISQDTVAVAETPTADTAAAERLQDANEKAERSIAWHRFPEARKRFEAVYRLDPGQVLRRIEPPFIPERREYYVHEAYSQAKEIPEGPVSITFHWDGRWLMCRYMHFGNKRTLGGVLRPSLGLTRNEFSGPDKLLNMTITGDWIVHKQAGPAMLLKALERILQDELGEPIRFELRQVERDAIVASGTYKFHPIPTDYSGEYVHIYADTLAPKLRFGGVNYVTVVEFLRELGNVTGRWVIDQTDPSDATLSWRLHDAARSGGFATDPATFDKVLDNLSRQTSLKFHKERRKVKVWFVSREGDEIAAGDASEAGAATASLAPWAKVGSRAAIAAVSNPPMPAEDGQEKVLMVLIRTLFVCPGSAGDAELCDWLAKEAAVKLEPVDSPDAKESKGGPRAEMAILPGDKGAALIECLRAIKDNSLRLLTSPMLVLGDGQWGSFSTEGEVPLIGPAPEDDPQVMGEVAPHVEMGVALNVSATVGPQRRQVTIEATPRVRELAAIRQDGKVVEVSQAKTTATAVVPDGESLLLRVPFSRVQFTFVGHKLDPNTQKTIPDIRERPIGTAGESESYVWVLVTPKISTKAPDGDSIIPLAMPGSTQPYSSSRAPLPVDR